MDPNEILISETGETFKRDQVWDEGRIVVLRSGSWLAIYRDGRKVLQKWDRFGYMLDGLKALGIPFSIQEHKRNPAIFPKELNG